jgi:hypothetical protein
MAKRCGVVLAVILSIFLMTVLVFRADCGACDPENRHSLDTLIPPNYDGFQPPPKGQPYVDSTFCTEVKRLSDSGKGYVTNSEIAYFNLDDSYFIATENEVTYLYDGHDGHRIKEIGGGTMRPWWIRWPRADFCTLFGVKHTFDPARHFYKYESNEIRLYSVDTLDHIVLHKFTEYSEIGPAGGEGDISEDVRYWVLDGMRATDGELELFAYDLLDDQKGPVAPFEVGDVGGRGSGVDYATVSPSGQYVIIAWDAGTGDPFNGHYGVEVFDRDSWTYLRRIHFTRIHFALGYDAFGYEVMFAAAGNTSQEIQQFGIPDISLGDQISVRLDNGEGRKLLEIPKYADYILSVSRKDNRYLFLGYHARSSSPEELWYPYWGEIVAVPTDGSGHAIRLVHHRSRAPEGVGESKATNLVHNVNNGGTKVIFQSSCGSADTDLYFLDLSSIITPANPDLDSDGMPNSWEGEHGLDSSDPSDAALDNDGDGFTNLAEYEGGTAPNDGKVHPYLVVCGLGESASGWSEALYGDYSQKSWLRVGWSTYNEANGEVRVATGDIDGDGRDEIVLGLGPVAGNSGVPGGWFEILDDDESRLGWGRVSWSSYNSANGETWPACGDVDGDGADEIVIGLGSGGAGWFEVFDYGSGTVSHKAWVQVRWSAYRTSDGEVRPACGDMDSDGRDEIVVGLGSSGSGWFELFDDGEADYGHLGWQRVLWNEYNGMNGESRPACGDVDGDGVDEIVIGLGSGGAGWVEVFEYGGQGLTHRDWVRVRYQAYNASNGETRPACGDVDGDGKDEVVIGLGQGGGGYVAVCDDATQGYGHMAWARVHWQTQNTNNGETWPGVKK